MSRCSHVRLQDAVGHIVLKVVEPLNQGLSLIWHRLMATNELKTIKTVQRTNATATRVCCTLIYQKNVLMFSVICRN